MNDYAVAPLNRQTGEWLDEMETYTGCKTAEEAAFLWAVDNTHAIGLEDGEEFCLAVVDLDGATTFHVVTARVRISFSTKPLTSPPALSDAQVAYGRLIAEGDYEAARKFRASVL